MNCFGDSRRVLVVSNTAWSIVNFRHGLIRELKESGYEVIAVAPEDEYVSRLPCRFEPIRLNRKGTNPFEELRLYASLRRLYRRLRPVAVLQFTSKVNIYGTMAAAGLGIRAIDNISGLGSAFIGGGLVARIQRLLYRWGLRKADHVFFQNVDDAKEFVRRGLVRPDRWSLLPGSGVDLQVFQPRPKTAVDGTFGFLMIARLLRDKGVYEYIEAARNLRSRYPQAEWRLLGFPDERNPTSIPLTKVQEWSREGIIHFLGHSDDVREAIGQSDCVVLPSYREGTPRTLLEAAAMARPLIATDVPGCRQVVDDGRTGFLCRVRDARDLADRMERMLLMQDEQRLEMGWRGRAKMENEFDESIVIRAYLEALPDAREADLVHSGEIGMEKR